MRTKHHYTTIIAVLLMLLPLTACQKEQPWAEEEFKKAVDAISGTYALKNVIWQGPAVDIDNDGKVSKNFIDIFNEHTREEIYISHVDYDQYADSQMSIPIHCKVPSQFLIQGNPDMVIFDCFYFQSYLMVGNGKINLPENMKTDFYYVTEDVRNSPNYNRLGEARKICHTGYAQIEIHIDPAIYDYATQSWVQAHAIYQYERIHY